MLAFQDIHDRNLRGLTIRDTMPLSINDYDGISLACNTFLQDIGASEGRAFPNSSADYLKRVLLTYFPDIKWGAMLAVHEAIVGGHADVRAANIGSIIRLLRKVTDQVLTPKAEHEFIKGPETIEHRDAYLERFPDHSHLVDHPVTMDAFLALHRAGTFPALEHLAKMPAVEEGGRKIMGIDVSKFMANVK